MMAFHVMCEQTCCDRHTSVHHYAVVNKLRPADRSRTVTTKPLPAGFFKLNHDGDSSTLRDGHKKQHDAKSRGVAVREDASLRAQDGGDGAAGSAGGR